MAERTIAVIDGNSLMHRAFHGIRQPMSAPDGRATNALYGFFNMFLKMVDSFKPDGIICAFDKGKPAQRIALFDQYKAQRPPMDPALREQFPMVKELLRAMDVPVCELEGWEGDDILGTLARRGEAAGYKMLLITGDRDMYQLATENILIVSTKKGLSDVQIMTPESVDDLYHGISPKLVPDFYGLKGDSSDNIPGVPGIGPKKAAALIVEYGSLDEVLAHADEVKGKMGESLRANVDNALLSRKLATIRCDAPLELDLAEAKFPTFDGAKVQESFSKLGFNTMIRRILALAGDEALAAAKEQELQGKKLLELPKVRSGKETLALVEALAESGQWISAALEELGAESGQLSLGLEKQEQLWLATSSMLIKVEHDDIVPALCTLLEKGQLIAFDLKRLLRKVVPLDSSLPRAIEASALDADRLFDAELAAYLLDSDKGDYNVEGLVEAYAKELGFNSLPEPQGELTTAAIHSFALLQLVKPLAAALEADGSAQIYRNMEMPLLLVLCEMERRGLKADAAEFGRQSLELGAEIAALAEHIHAEAGEDFNIDSPQQLSRILFDVWQLPTQGLKKTKSGFYSTNAKVISDLAEQDGRVREVLDYRERTKLKSTYLDALPQLILGDGRIHTSFNQKVAATGRLSSSDPNLQNIPTRSELGHRVRTAFSVDDDKVFLACDYSQIELRLLAHLSQDEHLIAAFNAGEDFHAQTAARVFNVDISEVTPALRSHAKAVNFGIVYGQQAFGLSQTLSISRAEAQRMIDRYFAAYPQVKHFLDNCIQYCRDHGYVQTLYGRKRHIKDIASSNFNLRSFAERTAMNHPMQGTAADIIKLAMIEVEKNLAASGLGAKLVLQIHDEVDLEVPKAELEATSKLVKEAMESVVKLDVPLIAEVSYGKNWAEAK